MPNNVIEIVLRAKDQATGALKSVGSALTGVKGILAGIGAGLVIREFIKNTEEAQQATLQLRNALKLVGAQAGLTEKSVDDFSQQIQRTTTFSDEAGKEAVTLALRLGLTGNTIKRVVRDATDLAAATGGDLVSATQQLSRALADPERGMLFLRRAGVILSQSQQDLVKSFSAVGDKAAAQNIILKAVEDRYNGAAAAATNTLGGALKQLKNVFGDLFEGSEGSTSKAVEGIKSLTDVLSGQAFKGAVDGAISLVSQLAGILAKTAAGLAVIFDLTGDRVEQINNEISAIDSLIKKTDAQIQKSGGGFGNQRNSFIDGLKKRREELLKEQRGLLGLDPKKSGEGTLTVPVELEFEKSSELISSISDLFVEVRDEAQQAADSASKEVDKIVEADVERIFKLTKTAQEGIEHLKEMYHALNVETETTTEKQSRELEEFKTKVDLLVNEGTITQEQAVKRVEEFRDKQSTAYGQIVESARRATEQIHDAFANVFASIGQGGIRGFARSIVQAIQTMMANILATIAIQVLGIEKLMKRLAASIQGVGGGGGGSSFAGGIGSFVSGLFGFAGGGRPRGLAVVGEEGPELANFGAGGQVWNKRQLAFAGAGGGAVNFSPTYNVSIDSSNPEESERRLMSFFMLQSAKQKDQLLREMRENGIVMR